MPAVGLPWYRRALRIRDRLDDRGAVGLTFDDGPHPDGHAGGAWKRSPRAARARRSSWRASRSYSGRRWRPKSSLPGTASRSTASITATSCGWARAAAREDLARGAAAIEDATGVAVTQFRPPLGYLTAAALSFARAQDWEVVLWKRIGYDWRPSATPERIARRVTRGLRGGEIIVLHDADFYSFPGAWRATAGSLPLVFERLQGARPARRSA